jgi:hypothetical protein
MFFDAKVGSFGVAKDVHDKSRTMRSRLKSTILKGSRTLPERFISGDDLQSIGFKKGPALGETLEEAFNLQLEDKLKSREDAIRWAELRK